MPKTVGDGGVAATECREFLETQSRRRSLERAETQRNIYIKQRSEEREAWGTRKSSRREQRNRPSMMKRVMRAGREAALYCLAPTRLGGRRHGNPGTAEA